MLKAQDHKLDGESTASTFNPFIELNLLNKHFENISRKFQTVEIDQTFYTEIMKYIKCLEEENQQLKEELDIATSFKLVDLSRSPMSTRTKSKQRQVRMESKHSRDNSMDEPIGDVENFFAQLKKIQYGDSATKTQQNESFNKAIKSVVSSSSFLHKHMKNKKSGSELKVEPHYREANMNNVEVLRGFLRLLGIPSRSYKEIQEEIMLFQLKEEHIKMQKEKEEGIK